MGGSFEWVNQMGGPLGWQDPLDGPTFGWEDPMGREDRSDGGPLGWANPSDGRASRMVA